MYIKSVVCVCLDMLRSECVLSLKKDRQLSSRTGGGGGAAHTCSAQIRLICLGLASHSLFRHWRCQFLRLKSQSQQRCVSMLLIAHQVQAGDILSFLLEDRKILQNRTVMKIYEWIWFKSPQILVVKSETTSTAQHVATGSMHF